MNLKTATFGSGCFWCTEAIFELVEGVNDVIGFIKNLDLIKSKAPIGVEIFSEELYKLPKEEIGKITGYSVKKVVDKARKDT